MLKKGLIGVLALFLLAIAFLGYLYVGSQKKSTSLLDLAANYSVYGRVNSAELINMMNSESFENFPVVDSSINWKKIIGNPMELGIDFFSEPVLFWDDESWNIAAVIQNEQKFTKWCRANLLKELEGKYSINKTHHLALSDVPLSMSWNDEYIIIRLSYKSQTDDSTIFAKNPSSSRIIKSGGIIDFYVNKVEESNEIAGIWMPKDTGQYSLEVDRKEIKIRGGNTLMTPSTDAFRAAFRLDSSMLRDLSEILARLLKTSEKGVYGNWGCRFSGITQTKTKTVSYEYDDDFNKQEVVSYSTQDIPDMQFLFVPSFPEISDPFSQFGAYSLFSKKGNSGMNYSSQPNNYEYFSAKPYCLEIDVDLLSENLTLLGIEIEGLNQFKKNGLKSFGFQNNNDGYGLTIKGDGKRHVASILAEFLLHVKSTNQPES